MSEIRVNSVKGVGASTAAISIDNSSGTCTANITNNLSNRNKIINGAMAVHQRNTSVTGITSAGYYTADRMQLAINTAGTWTNTISTDTPDGFANSYKLDCTTANSSLNADTYLIFRQIIEGQNLQDLAKGTSSAKKLTLSFYLKTNKTGTYVIEILDNPNSRQVSKSYTVSNTNWNRYTISFPADTSGSIANGVAAGLHIHFWLAAGTTYTSGTQQTSWAATVNANRANGLNVNLADNTSNEWLITGIQLEVDNLGSGIATDFEHKLLDQDYDACLRYAYVINVKNTDVVDRSYGYAYSDTILRGLFYLPKAMRTYPSYTGTATDVNFYASNNSAYFHLDDIVNYIGSNFSPFPNTFAFGFTSSSMTGGHAGVLLGREDDGKITFDAEL